MTVPGSGEALRPLGGLVGPTLGHLAVLDRRVFVPRVVVAGHRHDGSIEDLPTARDIPSPRQIAIELLEQRLEHPRLRQPLAIEPDSLGIRHPVLQPKTKEPHEGQPVAHLTIDLVVGKVVERAQHECLLHNHCVHRLAPGPRLPMCLGWKLTIKMTMAFLRF